jgi:hypothetical protein
MTEEEKRRQKADLLLEYQEAQDHVANLEEKAKRIAESLRHIARWLGGAVDEDVSENSYPLSDPAAITMEQRYRQAMNFEEMMKLTQKITVAQRRLVELDKRKRSLGLK